MRVLLLAENSAPGGINTYTVLLAEGLQTYGVTVDVAAVWPKPDNWLQDQCSKRGIPFTILAPKRSVTAIPACMWKLSKRIKETPYTIVHTQGHYSGLVGRGAYLLSGKQCRMAATVHGIAEDPRLGLKMFYWLDWWTFFLNHTSIANSQDTAQRVKQKGVRTPQINVVLHGIVSRAKAEQIYAITRKNNSSRDVPPSIYFVGRLSPEKGCAVLIEAANILKKRGRQFRLFLVGDGPQRSHLESMMANYQLGSEVTFEGWQSDVEPYYQQADIVVVPSLRESLGFTILESMFYGCAVVASNVQGIPEIVTDGQTGILVKADDPESLANALERCLANPLLRASLGEVGRQYVCTHHTIESMTDQTLALYQQVLEVGGS